MNNPKKILTDIEKVRKIIGVPLYEIVKHANVSKKTVDDIRGNKVMPRLDTLCEYCNYLGLDIKIVPRGELEYKEMTKGYIDLT